MDTDEKYMARCLQLALCGRYGAAPNPMVGAVVVHNGRIVGEGYHIRCGCPHAEVNAIGCVADDGMLRASTLYVSLEPCAHWGRTPPCADLIIRKGIRRVVVGCVDPFEKVAGRGIRRLHDAGIDVVTGVLEDRCLWLNRRFFTFHTLHRPYVTLKWAESADGFIDAARVGNVGRGYVISTPFTRMLVHRVRSFNQAVLVGRRTALLDNPQLTNRLWAGPQPLRLVIDRRGCLPKELCLFNGESPARVYIDKGAAEPSYGERGGVTCVRLDFGGDVLRQIMGDLSKLGVLSLLVEGGCETIERFMEAGLWDEVRIERSAVRLGSGVAAPRRPVGRSCAYSADGHEIIRIFSPQNRFAACVIRNKG